MPLSDCPTAIVTGAGGGVGLEVARALAAQGWALLLTSRTASKLEAAAESIAATCPEAPVAGACADLTDPQAAEQLVVRCGEAFGRLDALVHVAGYASRLRLGEGVAAEWRRTLDVNLSSVLYLTDAAWPMLAAGAAGGVNDGGGDGGGASGGGCGSGGGVIVSVSSMAAFDPFPGFCCYAPAKAGLNMFTRCAAQEGAEAGIRAYGVAPGAIETPMLRGLFSREALPPEKTLAPAEVAHVVVELVLGRREVESGQTLPLPSP